MLIASILLIPDNFQFILVGVILALGLQNEAAIGCFLLYFPLLQPIALYFAFWLGWKVHGLFFALIIVTILICFYYIYLLLSNDWMYIAIKAKQKKDEEKSMYLGFYY